jgi:hypothetical protein
MADEFNRYRTRDGEVWFEIYPGRLVKARSQREATKLKNQGLSGVDKNYIRNEHGPLQKL